MIRSKRGQSTLEYIIIFTVIVGAVWYAANTLVKSRVTNMLDHATEQAENAVERIDFSAK